MLLEKSLSIHASLSKTLGLIGLFVLHMFDIENGTVVQERIQDFFKEGVVSMRV